jgi:2-iminoacetate synthase ThiH
MSLMQEMASRAQLLGIPMSAHLDVTYRCNERCVHCYLDHDDNGEMTTAEIKDLLDQLAEAGVHRRLMAICRCFHCELQVSNWHRSSK